MADIAVVTGGNRGIGFETCRQLAQQGFQVILGARDPEKGAAAAARLAEEGLAVRFLQLDVANQQSVDQAITAIEQEYGRLDVLINNAAILYDSWQHASTADLTVVQQALDTNLVGAWRLCEACLPLLHRSMHGRIVNVSSEAGSLAAMGSSEPAYRVSKAALNALTRVLAAELHGTGILVNAICPGSVAPETGSSWGRPVAEGAASIVWAALLPADGPTGGFFRDGLPLPW